MKTLKTILFLTAILLSFNPAKADPPSLSAALNNVTRAYFGIKNALVANNPTTAQNKAMDMIAALNAVPDGNMSAGEHQIWFDYLNKLQFDSRHISENNPIDHKREHFADLSENLYTVLKAFKLNTTTVYRQYCPMQKAYWLSETAAIKNPYFGTGGAMLTCGVTKDVLKAGK
jgi:hypothetical protein